MAVLGRIAQVGSEAFFEGAGQAADRLERAVEIYWQARRELVDASLDAHRYSDELAGEDEIFPVENPDFSSAGPVAGRLSHVIELLPEEILAETYSDLS